MAQSKYTDAEFVNEWQNNPGTLSDIGAKLGVTVFNVERYAAKLRKKGVKLKDRRPNPIRSEVDVDALNALIEGNGGSDSPGAIDEHH